MGKKTDELNCMISFSGSTHDEPFNDNYCILACAGDKPALAIYT